MTTSTQLSAAQIKTLNIAAKYPRGVGVYLLNAATVKALGTRGLLATKIMNFVNAYCITPAGCEAIGLDYDEVIEEYNASFANRLASSFVREESVTITEVELSAMADKNELDIETLRKAFIAYGGEVVGEAETTIEDVAGEDTQSQATLGDELYEVAPVTPLLLAHGFKPGQTVRAHYFIDPQFKNEIYKCEVLGVKETWAGISLLVQPCANRFNLLSRWITVHQCVSADTPLSGEELYQDMVATQAVSNEYALLDTFDLPADHATYKRKVQAHITALRAAAAYTGCSAEAVIEYLYGKGKTVQAPPIVPQDALPRLEASTEAIVTAPVIKAVDAHETDNGRKTGVIDSYSVSHDYGYVFYEGESLKFTRVSVLGGGAIAALIKGQTVTFAQGVLLNATNIVIPGNESSETAYAYLARRKADAKKAETEAKAKDAARKERLAASRANRESAPIQGAS